MSNDNGARTAGVDLDKLAELAGAVGRCKSIFEISDALHALHCALDPAHVLQLIDVARRAEPSVTEVSSDGLIYEAASRRADPEGHAAAIAQMDDALARAALASPAVSQKDGAEVPLRAMLAMCDHIIHAKWGKNAHALARAAACELRPKIERAMLASPAATTASASGEPCPSCNDVGWPDGEGGLMECPTCGRAPAASRDAARLNENALEALMHKHDLIGVAGDNPNWEAKLIGFANDAAALARAPLPAQGVGVVYQARSPEGDPWAEVTREQFDKARTNGYETRVLYAAPAQAGDARDAARYRWLRACGPEFDDLSILDARGHIIPESLDEAIDAAMSASQGKTPGASHACQSGGKCDPSNRCNDCPYAAPSWDHEEGGASHASNASEDTEQDAIDAARYRFLRVADLDAIAAGHWQTGRVIDGVKFDDAIDAAIAASAKEKNG